jgi:hypothetical protein
MVISGPDATLGTDSRNGAEIAVDDKGGQVLGHDIQFDGEDELCSAEGGQAAGTKLAADPTVVAVIGTSCSSAARVAVPLWSAAGFTIISASNTAVDLTLEAMRTTTRLMRTALVTVCRLLPLGCLGVLGVKATIRGCFAPATPAGFITPSGIMQILSKPSPTRLSTACSPASRLWSIDLPPIFPGRCPAHHPGRQTRLENVVR